MTHRLVQTVLRDVTFRSDPVDLGLAYSDEVPREALRECVGRRRDAIAGRLEAFRRLFEQAEPHLEQLEPMIFRHTFTRLQAEVAFHEELLGHLSKGDS